jgi:hypothetical protein
MDLPKFCMHAASFPNSQVPIFDKYPPNNPFTIPAILKIILSKCQFLSVSAAHNFESSKNLFDITIDCQP